MHHLPNEQDNKVPGSGLANKAAAAQSAHEPAVADELSAAADMQTAGLHTAQVCVSAGAITCAALKNA